jgi:predicted GNAT family N-acyltransferase
LALNEYLQKFATQHSKNDISKTYVLISEEFKQKVLGFYTLSAGSISFEKLPEGLKVPKYPVPIARIGRLAIDSLVQGKGMGEYLLMDALNRCAIHSEAIGIFGVVVDAKHDKAKEFYAQYGFFELTDTPLTLILKLQNVRKILRVPGISSQIRNRDYSRPLS